MELVTERLLLREITWEDLTDIHEFHSIPKVAHFNTIGIPKDLDATKTVLTRAVEDKLNQVRSAYGWTVRLKESNQFIGEAGMSAPNDRFKRAEIHYHIHPDLWGKGYATEVALRLIDFGFNTLNLHRVEAGVATENLGSVRVLEKSGMQREGLRRKILPIRGEWRDNYMYAILDTDFYQ